MYQRNKHRQTGIGYQRLFFLPVFFASLLLGCGKSDKMTVHPVEGSVTVSGKPAAGVEVCFYGTDTDLMKPTAPFPRGTTASDGSFQLTSYDENDGAPAGNLCGHVGLARTAIRRS